MDLKVTAEIDLMESAAYIVTKNGKLIKLPVRESRHGKHVINWQGGKPYHVKLETDMKF